MVSHHIGTMMKSVGEVMAIAPTSTKQIDTVAGEFPAKACNYLYLTYSAQHNDVDYNTVRLELLFLAVECTASEAAWNLTTAECFSVVSSENKDTACCC